MILTNEDNELDWTRSIFDVDVFSKEESYRIFRYFCEQKFEEDEVDNLLKHIKYNPRAIKMCAVFLQENDLFTISSLLDGISSTDSVKNIMRNLYMILSELSIFENDNNIKLIAECLSLIPYNGVSKERFQELMIGIKDVDIDEKQIYAGLGKLVDSGESQILCKRCKAV